METIRKQALKLYKKTLSSKLGYAFTYGFIVLLCFAISFYFPYAMILFIPFIIIPFTFALQLCVANANNNIPYSLKSLFLGFKMYYSRKFYGCYGVLQAAIKFSIAFIAIASISSIVIVPIYCMLDSGFNDLVNLATNATTIEELENITTQIVEYGHFYTIQSSASLFAGLYWFFHHIMSNSIKGAMGLYTPQSIDMSSNKLMHRVAFRTFRRRYYKDYYASNWFFIIIFLFGFVGGMLLSIFVIPNEDRTIYVEQAQLIAVAIPFVISLPFIPLFFDSIELLYKRHSEDYKNASIKGVMDNIDKILKDNTLSQEEKDAINRFVKEQEEKENPETKSSEETKNEDDSSNDSEAEKNTDESV